MKEQFSVLMDMLRARIEGLSKNRESGRKERTPEAMVTQETMSEIKAGQEEMKTTQTESNPKEGRINSNLCGMQKNGVTKKHSFPLTCMEDTFDTFSGSKLVLTLELKSGY
ncbi:hypothetical protein NPIL_335391 [Nephila pilipes]|uniref:Uncharacterized protein n=1 Tax=Nephila pilipes TaxID=299642 RepID=A0A8X6MCN3_NEPPI|nr:hypothetical protein NPIL_335391 [Nephila pilipes]